MNTMLFEIKGSVGLAYHFVDGVVQASSSFFDSDIVRLGLEI